MENDNRKLYPLRFMRDKEEFSWGQASYHIADLGFKDSMVENGWFGGNSLSELVATYLERAVGDDNFEYYGLQFPVMLKLMDVKDWQPLQVNPDDVSAEERYDAYGKKVLWYVEEADARAKMFLGFNREVSAEEFYLRCNAGTVEEILNEIHPKKGEYFLIEPGTVFAAGPGLMIVEVSECSELTFNLHYWGRELSDSEQVHLEEAFDLIDFNEYSPSSAPADLQNGLDSSAPGSEILAACPEFIVTRILLKDALRIRSDQPGSFALYYCLSGEMSVQVQAEDGRAEAGRYEIKAGQSILLPSEVNDFMIVPLADHTVLLETMVEKRMLQDSYTSENVEPNAIGADASAHQHVKDYS